MDSAEGYHFHLLALVLLVVQHHLHVVEVHEVIVG